MTETFSMVSDLSHDLDQMLTSDAYCQDPYPAYRRLLAEAPVFWSEGWNAWVISSFDDVQSSLRDAKNFSSAGRMPLLTGGMAEATRREMRNLEPHFTQGLIHTDPPDHTRLRGLVNKAFTSRAVERLRPQIEALVDELLDQVADRGEMEVVRDLAYPLPATVIALMLGAPPEDRDRFKQWSDEIVALQESDLAPETVRQARHSIEEMKLFLADLLRQRRAKPEDDLLSNLAAVEEDGRSLTTDELLATCVTLLIAGHETTTSLIASGLLTLLRHPDQLAQLRRDPELIGPAIEEIVRYESPIQRDFRRVATDIEFGGHPMRAGSLVFQMLGAANRDPKYFSDPDRFDINREKRRHLAFGYGIHFCVGAPLARLEGPIAIMAVLRRMPDLTLATDDIVWQGKRSFRCPTAVPVRFTPGAVTLAGAS
jgi:pimeloyl-[acyl-carrier protein] synthase